MLVPRPRSFAELFPFARSVLFGFSSVSYVLLGRKTISIVMQEHDSQVLTCYRCSIRLVKQQNFHYDCKAESVNVNSRLSPFILLFS
jgi:hypothetical protein